MKEAHAKCEPPMELFSLHFLFHECILAHSPVSRLNTKSEIQFFIRNLKGFFYTLFTSLFNDDDNIRVSHKKSEKKLDPARVPPMYASVAVISGEKKKGKYWCNLYLLFEHTQLHKGQ